MSKDYYDLLGVSKSASSDEIKTAFRKKAHEHHPDKGGDEAKFKEINEAYQVLGNAEKRKQYDQFGSAAFNGGGSGYSGGGYGGQGFGGFSGMNINMDDLGDMFGGFGDIFGFGGGSSRGSSRQPLRGEDLEFSLPLEFLEAAFGLEKEISFDKDVVCAECSGSGAEPGAKIETCSECGGSGSVIRMQRTILGNIQSRVTCSRCGGEGKIFSKKCSRCGGAGIYNDKVKLKVRIPAGIDDGESIRLSGQGAAGRKGSPAGDLYLRVKVKPNKRFIRDGYDIRTERTISVKQAILGDKIDIENIHGSFKLKIPEGTQSGTIFKVKEKGITRLRGAGLGDHYVKVRVLIPKNLDRRSRKALEEMDI